jgi:type IV secretion system protein VirB3
LKEEPLFLAITRPALLWGVPIEAAVLSVVLGCIASFLTCGTLILFLPFAAVLFVAARLVSARDPLIFGVLFAWLQSRPRGVASSRLWGGISMSPLAADIDERKPGRA